MNLDEPERRGVAAWLWRRPRRWFLLGIPVGGLLAFLAGIAFTGGFFGAVQLASTEQFCTSCHEMNTPFQELTHSRHHANEFGIRATCADCHVPPTFVAGLMRHAAASTEVWGHLRGELDTPAKYESRRLQLAQKIWKELKANDSAECRSCHTIAAMASSQQSSTAASGVAAISSASMHQSLAPSLTCIDCHKGVAHTLPKDS
jgi:nitrate/TMAO reductase-like tetraheme cytochrome c subunit